jgi:hypothetical protein
MNTAVALAIVLAAGGSANSSRAKQRVAHGRVIDSVRLSPLPKASIQCDACVERKCRSEDNGTWIVNPSRDTAMLLFKMDGYVPHEVPINWTGTNPVDVGDVHLLAEADIKSIPAPKLIDELKALFAIADKYDDLEYAAGLERVS